MPVDNFVETIQNRECWLCGSPLESIGKEKGWKCVACELLFMEKTYAKLESGDWNFGE